MLMSAYSNPELVREALAAGAILFAAIAFAALSSAPAVPLAPAAGDAPVVHDHGSLEGSQQAAPFEVRDHTWYEEHFGLQPQAEDAGTLRSNYGR